MSTGDRDRDRDRFPAPGGAQGRAGAGAEGAEGDERDRDLDWVLTVFCDRIPGTSSALVVTTDGLVLALSSRIERDTADQLAAITSGLTSLSAGAARCFEASPVNQLIVEMEGGYLFVTSISESSALAVMCEPSCDIGLIGYEMSLLVARIGRVLTPALRAQLQGTPPV
jgi:predicted regulator of Ras-like GTPase activity (Roadblock/LC7/MglB family)